jgi:Rha family phage regulatory protein
MNEATLSQEGIVFYRENEVFTNSLNVAKQFGKRHPEVLRSIRNLLRNLQDITSDKPLDPTNSHERRNFAPPGAANFPEAINPLDPTNSHELSNFAQPGAGDFSRVEYVQTNNLNKPVVYDQYEITKDGFMLLVMGFTGPKALEVKIKYIAEFNRMAAALNNSRQSLDQMAAELHARTIIELESKTAEQAKLLENIKSKEAIFDKLLSHPGEEPISAVAGMLKIKDKELTDYFIHKKWLKRVRGRLLATHLGKRLSYLVQGEDVRTFQEKGTGEDRTATNFSQVMVTPKLFERLTAKGLT